jgi:hypothetical protein
MFERIGCKGAVDAVTAIINGTRVNSKWSSYDILILILDSSNNWISHQLNGPCGMLVGTWMTKRNGITRYMGKYQVRADTMAKEALQYWVDSGRQRISTTPVPGTPWTISISGKRITSKIRSEIYESVWTPQIQKHWCKRMYIEHEQSNLIDWITFGKTMKSCDDND